MRRTTAAVEGNEKAERKISSLNNTETKGNTCRFLDDRCRDVRPRAEVENTDAEIKKKKANGSMVTTFSRSAFLFSPLARLKRVNRKSQRAQWIMVMPQRAQVHDGNGDERAEVGRGGY